MTPFLKLWRDRVLWLEQRVVGLCASVHSQAHAIDAQRVAIVALHERLALLESAMGVDVPDAEEHATKIIERLH
ncbi:MAG TPA: hypothetical protein VMS04_15570 [Vicinamibacterales bacterium]|nr:hypothetical protein [Vicinamibacterales bacterium]